MITQPRRPADRPRRALSILPPLALLAVLAACEKQEPPFVPPPPPQVTVAHPVEGPVTAYLEFTGNVQSIRSVKLRARVEGYLEKVLYKEGDLVKEGQLLFLLQQNTYQAQLEKAEAEVLANKARLMHAQTEYDRFSALQQEDAAAQTDVDRWHYERDSARAAVQAAEAQVELARLNLGYTKVTAPFQGRVSRRLVDPGNLVGVGGDTELAEINQMNPIYAYFTISEQDLLRVIAVRAGKMDYAKVPPVPIGLGLADEVGYPHQGHLDYRGIFVDQTTGTLQLRALFENPTMKLVPGMFARLRAPLTKPEPSLLVPQAAVAYDQLGSYVYVVDAHNVVERRSVTLGPARDNLVSITSGLGLADRVVVNGLLRAIPGKPVTPLPEPSAAAAGREPAPAAIGKLR